jgi:pimeloyl-ACP methyl ester carboxylesterase
MTPIEGLLALLDVLALSVFLIRKGRIGFAGKIFSLAAFVTAAATLMVELPRWQVYPAVFVGFALILTLFRSSEISWLGRLLAACGYALTLGSLAAAFVMPIFKLPTPAGAHAIGTNTRVWYRTEQTEHSGGTGSSRKIVVQFWYPAAAGQGGKYAPYRDAGAGTRMSKYLQLVKTHAKQNVKLDGTQQQFPLLIFSPLWNSGRSPYAIFYEELASQGFIVAAVEHLPDFPREADEIENMEKIGELDSRATKRALDLILVLDKITELNHADPENLLTGKVDLDRVGVMGHSFGGAASIEACYLDKRFKSAVDLDGAVYGAVGYSGPPQPIFYFLSDGLRDVTPLLNSSNKDDRDDGIMEQLDRDRKIKWLHQYGGYYLRIRDSLHLDFTDRPRYSRMKRLTMTSKLDPEMEEEVYLKYTVAFFEQTLNGKDEPLLRTTPSPYPNVIFLRYPSADAPYDPYSLSK